MGNGRERDDGEEEIRGNGVKICQAKKKAFFSKLDAVLYIRGLGLLCLLSRLSEL